ncbi:MAG: hypothetical protein AB8H79_20930, partial [Myxococcota bacterium]
GGIHRFRANVALNRIREGIDGGPATRPTEYLDVLGPNVFASYGAELGRIVAVYAEAGWRQDLDFQFLDRANSTSVSSTLTLRPTAGIRLDTTVRGDRLDRPRESDAQAALIRHWTSWQFTQELGLRSMIEYSAGNERDDRLVTTVLLTWLENPGTAVHLGWIERTGLEDQPKTLDRTVFLKASVLFRP